MKNLDKNINNMKKLAVVMLNEAKSNNDSILFNSLEQRNQYNFDIDFLMRDKSSAVVINRMNRLAKLDRYDKYNNARMLVSLFCTSDIEPMLFKDMKSADRILDAALFLLDQKHSSIIDQVILKLNDSSMQALSIEQLLDASIHTSKQCYARVRNAIIALRYFHIIETSNCSMTDNFISSMSKQTIVNNS